MAFVFLYLEKEWKQNGGIKSFLHFLIKQIKNDLSFFLFIFKKENTKITISKITRNTQHIIINKFENVIP